MKKIFSLCLLSTFLFSLTASPGFCQTAKEIVGKMVEAQGGKKVFENTKDMTLSGTFSLVQQGLSGSVTVYKKEPDKRRMDFEVMGMVVTQAYDGKTAWATDPQTGSTGEMPEQQAAEMKRDAMPLVSILYPEKYGLSFTLKEKEKIEGKDHFVLEITFPDGFKATLYIDSETYLTYKTKATTMGQMGIEVEVEQFASDYKKVDGMILAHSITIFQDGEEYLNVTITEVSFNTGLEDSLFKKSE